MPGVDLRCLKYHKLHERRVAAIFEAYDAEKSGELSKAQVEKALRDLGISTTPQLPRQLTLAEFQALFEASRLRAAFESFDLDGDGEIGEKELTRAFRKFDARIDERQARLMLEKIGGGRIDYLQFFEAFEFVPFGDLQFIAKQWTDLTAGQPRDSSAAPSDGCGGNTTGRRLRLPREPAKLFAAHNDEVMPSREEEPGTTTDPAALRLHQTVIAGGLANCCARTATAPLERLKLEAQTSSGAFKTWTEARQIVRSEGWLGLYRGNLLHCARVFPMGAISCSAFVHMLSLAPAEQSPEQEELWRVSSCCVATGVASTLTYPLDTLRTRWTVVGGIVGSPDSVSGLLSSISRTDGLRSLFRGIGPNLYSVIPWVAVQQWVLDSCRFFAVRRGCDAYDPCLLTSVGAFSGLVAQTVVHPLEVVRRRMQLGASGDVVTVESSVVPNRTTLAFRHIIRNEGVGALYAGLTSHCLKCIPNAAVGYLVCLTLCDRFRKSNERRLGLSSPDDVAVVVETNKETSGSLGSLVGGWSLGGVVSFIDKVFDKVTSGLPSSPRDLLQQNRTASSSSSSSQHPRFMFINDTR
mmetsp:Transcript_18548/g.56996  ORF Transcript_18548/g.56996 Transcript_18548/m.56996 type:complete len:580 (-) Transcript_18548:375-2114(-)